MAQFVEIEIDQGTDFSLDLGLKNDDGTRIDLSGYTFSSEIRKTYSSSVSVATFDCNVLSGNLILSLDDQTTAAIKPGRYVFDIKRINNNTQKITRLAEGIVNINPQVTR